MKLFKGKKPGNPTEQTTWHPVLRADIHGRSFSFDGSRSYSHVCVGDYRGILPHNMAFQKAADLREFGEDCIKFADRCEGLRSFTETDVRREK